MALQKKRMGTISEFCSSQYKIVILGDRAVGKTSVIFQYVRQFFPETTFFTQNTEEHLTTISYDGEKILLKIVDTPGQIKYRILPQRDYRSTDGIIFVYDVTRRDSFEAIKNFIEEFKLNNESQNSYDTIPKLMIGNKIDLAERDVLVDEARNMAKRYKIWDYFETSAKENRNVMESFEILTQKIFQWKQMKPKRPKNIDKETSCLCFSSKRRR